MRTVPACWRVLAGVALAWAAAPAFLAAAPAAPDRDEKAPSPVEKLRKDLDKNVTIRIEKQPLSLALEMLRAKTGVAFITDNQTIQQQLNFLPDMPPTPVDVDLKDVKLRSALRTILAPYGLSYAPIEDTIIVTTEDMAMLRQMRQHVNVDLNKVELGRALRQLGRDTATNLIVDTRAEKDAQTPVTVQLEDVPLETAVRLLSEMAGLRPVRVGNILFVTKKDIANELRNDPDLMQPGQPMPGQPGAAVPGIAVAPNPPAGAPAPPPTPPPGVAPAVDPDKPADETKPADPKPAETPPRESK